MNLIERLSRLPVRPIPMLLVVLLVAAGAVTLSLSTAGHRVEAVRPENATGDAVCLSCHQEKSSFEATAHRLTSRLPTRQAILGSFSAGENVLQTSNADLYFRMDSTASGYYQTAVTGRAPDTTVRAGRIAYVTGLRKGQSYLHWSGDRLYQLPVSYWTELGWANSPAYADGRAHFERPILPRCLECHATWIESVPDSLVANRYRPTGAILGITCETCHGAGQAHVRRERSAWRAVLPPAIVNPATLPRERQLDGCALCHGGTAPLETAPFSYVPGQPLEKRFDLWAPSQPSPDVHGDQMALLERSRCFRASEMTCATCHDVHRQERDVVALSARCLACHTVASCGLFPREGQALVGRCVDCHMPTLPSNLVVANHQGLQARTRVRTHWIKVYPELHSP